MVSIGYCISCLWLLYYGNKNDRSPLNKTNKGTVKKDLRLEASSHLFLWKKSFHLTKIKTGICHNINGTFSPRITIAARKADLLDSYIFYYQRRMKSTTRSWLQLLSVSCTLHKTSIFFRKKKKRALRMVTVNTWYN